MSPPSPRVSPRVLGDGATVAMAIGAFVGAYIGWSVNPALPAVGVVIALIVRRPALFVVATVVLAAALGARSIAALHRTVPERDVEQWTTVVGDPVRAGTATRIDLRIGTARVEATAYGAVQSALARRLTGERVFVVGRLRPRPPDAPWLDERNITARLDVREVRQTGPARWPYSWANAMRRTLERGVRSLPPERRTLFTGLVYGDDRDQSPVTADDFRGAGLGHLLAVSGENVAFVLALVAPLLKRLRFWVRFAALCSVLAFFSLVTRFEPSVLRAVFMAALGGLASALGRTVSGRRRLALVCTLLVLIDPVIARSVGFQLSVLATAGIIELAPAIARRLPGPRLLAGGLSVTIAAQLAVAPIQVARFGGLPLVSVAANVLGVPAAGPVMMWGLTAGVLAGVTGGWLAHLVHLPTHVLIWWIATVAHIAVRVPAGELRTVHLVLIALGIAAASVSRWLLAKSIAVALLAVALVHPMLTLSLPAGQFTLAPGVVAVRGSDGTTVLTVRDDSRASTALEALRRHGVRRAALVIAIDGGRSSGEVVRAVQARVAVGAVWAPLMHQIRGAQTPAVGTYRAGGLVIDVVSTASPLLADVRVASPP